MYYVIEHSPIGMAVIGTPYYTEEEARDSVEKLEMNNEYCNYYVTKSI